MRFFFSFLKRHLFEIIQINQKTVENGNIKAENVDKYKHVVYYIGASEIFNGLKSIKPHSKSLVKKIRRQK